MPRYALPLFIILSLLLASLPLLQPVNALEQPILYVFKPPSLKVVGFKGFQLPVVKGYHLGGPPGAPILPSKTYTFLLPPNADLSSVKLVVVELKRQQLKGSYHVPPAPPFLPGSPDSPSVGVGTPNMEIYGRDALYPSSPVSIVAKGQVREAKLVKVEFTPVQYNPVEKKLYLVERAVVKIAFKVNPDLPSTYTSTTLEMLKELGFNIVNKGDLQLYEQNAVASQQRDGYLIVTTNSIVSNSQKLDDFKSFLESRGFNVYVITEDEYGADQGQQRAVNIREWIKRNYQLLNIKYVLLIGNPDPDDPLDINDSFGDVPMIMACNISLCFTENFCQSSLCPTDYFYADLTGTWDYDGDGLYGEYPDDVEGIDLYPDVLVGRIPVYNDDFQQLDYILDKIMNFNQLRGAWLYKALLPMAISNYENEDGSGWPCTDGRDLPKNIIERVLIPASPRFPVPFKWCVFYEREGLDPVPEDAPYFNMSITTRHVIGEWQKGYGIVFWWGHGSPTGVYRKVWYTDDGDGVPELAEMKWKPIVTSSNVTLLSDRTPSFVYQAACLNGEPENPDNLGYSLLKRGAIATVSSSRVSWYQAGLWNPDGWADNVEIGYWCVKNLVEFMPLGAALYAAKAELYRSSSFDPNALGFALMNLFDFNLYGDPSLQLYKPVKPKIIRVDDDRSECPDAEYTSISEAIAAALPHDVILVYPGKYSEAAMVIDKPLTIASAMEEPPVVSVFSPGLPAFAVQGTSEVLLKGLVINTGQCCIEVNDCSVVFISQCSFSAPRGVLVGNSCRVLIDGCKASDALWGVTIEGGREVLVLNCLFRNCTNMGVLVKKSSTCLIAGSNFTGCHCGVCASFSRDLMIVYNYFLDSEKYDIYLENSSSMLCFNIFMEPKLLDEGRNNTWYNPDLEKGNYYSNHTSPDADQDGVVDEPYLIPGPAKSKDLYPLAEPPTLICEVLHLPRGWSAVSTPTLNPIGLGDLKAYNWTGTGYAEAHTLKPGVGYWVYSPFDLPLVILGLPMASCEVRLHAGWNFIGSIAVEAKLESAAGAVVFDWSTEAQSYSITTVLKPFKAYWVYSPSETAAQIVPLLR